MTQKQNSKIHRFLISALLLTMLALSVMAADTGKIPQREDIEDRYKWNVEDIYPDVASWEKDFAYLKENLVKFEQYKGHLADSPEKMFECLQLTESLGKIHDNLLVYAYLKFDEDNRVSELQELTGRIAQLSTDFSAAQSFIEPEILSIPGDQLTTMVNSTLEMGEYKFYLEKLTRQKDHILSEKEEAILAAAGAIAGTPLDVFQMIDNVDLKLGTVIDDDGNPIDLTWGRYARIMEEGSRELRRAANDTVQVQYLKYINTLAATLGGSIKKDLFFAKTRGYETTLDYSLDANNIPTSVYHNLIKAVNDNIEMLHKYTRLRKKVLGYDTLYTYDTRVPLGPKSDKEYSYEEAMEILNNGLKPLGKKYVDDLNTGFESGWVDAYESEGKATGAYSWGNYTSHPYVLMNFTGRLEDVFTLAHEMGHAVNTYYTNQNESYTYSNYSLFTAEVASTCNEAVLMKFLLAQSTDKTEKLALLNQYINNILGTFFTQVMFAEFELAIHEHVEAGGAVSVDYFRKTYRDIYQKYYGPELVISENNDMTGMKIYHFYRQFYVYQYATSYAAAEMISQKIVDGEEGAIESYIKFLSTGSSKYPVDVLKEAGVDMTMPEAIDRTIKLFGSLVDEMEKLLNES